MGEVKIVNINEDGYQILEPFFKEYNKIGLDKINTVVLHWTGGSGIHGAIVTLKQKGYGYHFLIEKDGKITQGATIGKRIGHAGNSYGPNGKDVNTYSVGVSLAIEGVFKNGTEEDIPEEMFQSVKTIILDLKRILPNLKYITGHHWVSPGRKIDPYTFDFDRLITDPDIKGLGLELWKTGYGPFPSGLKNCKCIEKRSDGVGCKKSTGDCIGQGGFKYSERQLSTVISDESFGSDLDTE